ncbi:MAG: transcriptional repressor [Planctomycetota bacterium]
MSKVRIHTPPPAPPGPKLPAGFAPPLCAVFRRHLKQQGLKFTTERAVLLDTVLAREGVFEADELIADLKRDHPEHRVSKATVYRTLKHLIDAGIIREVLLDATRAHYQLAYGKPVVGHLVHADTGDVTEFPTEKLDKFIRDVCKQQGLTPLAHRVVIYATPEPGNGNAQQNTKP